MTYSQLVGRIEVGGASVPRMGVANMDNEAEKMEREGVTDGEAGNGLMEQIQPRQDDY
jgi:hypothetical protein